MNNQFPKVGEVWMVDIPNTGGREIYGFRPAVIVSRTDRNQKCPIIKIIPLSRNDNKTYSDKRDKNSRSSMHHLISSCNYQWLKFDSVVLGEQETSCDISRFSHCLGKLNKNDLTSIALSKCLDESLWFMLAVEGNIKNNPRFVESHCCA